jgi:hypothetical protein
MPLPINNSRPAIPYVPAQILPNYDRYSSLGQFPPTAQQLDGDLNALVDFINTLADAINNTAAGIFPGADDPLNAGRLPTTDGAGNVSWTLINALNLGVNAVQTQHIQDTAITAPKIQLQGVGTNQLADGAVTTAKMNDGAVTPPKIPAGSLPFSKWVKPQTASLMGGTTTNGGSWYELTLGDYQIATKKPQNNGTTSVSLTEVWSGTNGTFDGGKITAASLVLGSLLSGQQSCVIAGTPTNNAYYEVPMGDWQIAVKRAQDNAPTAQTLDVIWSNTANSFNGAQITNNSLSGNKILDNSIGSSKLNNAGQMIPFAMGYVLSNGTLQKSLNVASVTRTGTGTYNLLFNAAANDNKYIVAFGAQGSNAYYLTAEVAQNTATTNGFTVNTGYNQSTVDGEFYFVVYAF